MEKESQTKDGLTRAIDEVLISEEKKGLSYLKPEPKYKSSDLDEFNRELEGIFDVENMDLKSFDSSHISDEGFISPENRGKSSASEARDQGSNKNKIKDQKTSLKSQNASEMAAIKERLGSFSVIRKNLGLNQRKTAKLLLVDPSAVNRWEKAGSDAPAYIYRALEWYSLLQKKHPMMGNSFWLQLENKDLSEKQLEKIKTDLKAELKSELDITEVKSQKNQFFNAVYTPIFIGLLALFIGFLAGKLT